MADLNQYYETDLHNNMMRMSFASIRMLGYMNCLIPSPSITFLNVLFSDEAHISQLLQFLCEGFNSKDAIL